MARLTLSFLRNCGASLLLGQLLVFWKPKNAISSIKKFLSELMHLCPNFLTMRKVSLTSLLTLRQDNGRTGSLRSGHGPIVIVFSSNAHLSLQLTLHVLSTLLIRSDHLMKCAQRRGRRLVSSTLFLSAVLVLQRPRLFS